MGDDLMYQALGAYTLMLGIWSLVGLLFYVWYLWALSRLFPQLGLPSAHGWIPVWNQWRLIERGGLPGWLVLLGIVPGLALVVIVVSIIAIHRINQEQGEGAGMTVLGAFIPPLWATLLGNKLRARDGVAQGVRSGDAQARGVQGRVAAQGGSGFQGAPFAAANTGLVEYGPDGQPYPLLQRGAPQPPVVRPQVVAPPAQNAPLPPAPPLPPAQNGAPAGPPAAQPAPAAQQPQFAQSAPPAAPPQHAPAAPAQQVPAPPAAPQQHARYQAPGVPTPAENQWVIGRTIDSNFERLANEEQPARRDAGLGSAPDARPFSWPEPMASVPPAPPAPPVASAPPAAPQDAPPAAPPAPPAAPPAAPPTAAPQSSAPQPSAPKPTYAPPTPQAPAQQPPAGPAQPAPQQAAAAPGQPAPAQQAQAQQAPRYALPEVEVEEGFTATVLTGAKQPIAEEPEEELDRTVVVSRRQDWVLELPDGSTLDLEGDDVVIGRRPSAVDGSSVLLVPDPTRTLSKSHARLRRNGESWTIEDLKSTNGVFVFDDNGSQIEVEPGEQKPASEQLIIGTLEVRLRTAE